jgi:transcriptional regulator with XRE-family HTH domain
MNKIRDFRVKSNMTQLEVSEILEISQGQYSYLENGKSIINARQILILCDLFKCSPNELLGFEGVHTIVAGKLDNEI